VEQELHTFPDTLISPLVFIEVRMTRSLDFCMFCVFFFLLVIVLSILLRFTASDYPFDR
jgi:hypothetical protein